MSLFTILIITIGFCAVASIIARLKPKKVVTVTTPKDEEKASLRKFFEGFIQPRSWYKALALGIMMTIILSVGYCVFKEVNTFFGKKTPPVVSTITNTGDGKVESKTESKTETKQSNGFNLNIFTGWF